MRIAGLLFDDNQRSSNKANAGSHNIQSFPAAPALALILATLLWAGNLTIGRAFASDIGPLTLNFLRWSSASCILLAIYWRRLLIERHAVWRHSNYVLKMTLTGVIAGHSLLYGSLRCVDVSTGALIMGLTPVAMLGFAHFAKIERMNLWSGLIVALGFAGVATLFGYQIQTAIR